VLYAFAFAISIYRSDVFFDLLKVYSVAPVLLEQTLYYFISFHYLHTGFPSVSCLLSTIGLS